MGAQVPVSARRRGVRGPALTGSAPLRARRRLSRCLPRGRQASPSPAAAAVRRGLR